jgi:cytochrome c oxidase cbb3-type subunit III
MRLTFAIFGLVLFASLGVSGCGDAPGRLAAAEAPIMPSSVSGFDALYGANCAGCHGADGKGGGAIALADPVYLAIVDDTILHRVTANGIQGTSMPAFAQSAGGMLTDKQIDTIARGIREHWSKADALQGAVPPPYSSTESGDSSRGAEVYATHCQSCHGIGGRGGQAASSIVDGSFLALLGDQELRTIVIVGRPELGAPDWRADLAGKPLSAEDVSDVVAWLASQRPQFPGQPYTGADKSTGETP